MLCLWILCGILYVRLGTIRGLLASSISLSSFALLIFSTSSVNKLWVYNCLEQFLYLGSVGSMCSFLWSSSQVLVHLVGICSFLVLVCREWRWISWTRIHAFHHVLAFSSLISFSVFLSNSMCISALGPSSIPSSSPVILSIHSAFSLCFLGCHIFVPNCSVSLASGCWYVFVPCPPNCW